MVNPYVAIAERMVLDDKIRQVGRFSLDTRVQFLTVKGLIDIAEDTLSAAGAKLFEANNARERFTNKKCVF